MNTIIIKGDTFYVKPGYDSSEYGCGAYTKFYTEVIIRREKKYFFGLVGPMIEKEIGIGYAFNVNFDIMSASYTKEYVKSKLESEYDLYKRRLKRLDEIKNGTII